jgi:hypothetical protein
LSGSEHFSHAFVRQFDTWLEIINVQIEFQCRVISGLPKISEVEIVLPALAKTSQETETSVGF